MAAARAAADAEDIPDVDEGGRPLTKKERTARHRAATKEREAVADAHASRMVPEVRRSAVAPQCPGNQIIFYVRSHPCKIKVNRVDRASGDPKEHHVT